MYLADGTHLHPGTGLVEGGPGHNDNDPETKNAVSRAAVITDDETADPTTPKQARSNGRRAASSARRASRSCPASR